MAATGIQAETKPDKTAKTRLVENFGMLPLSFEANRGQTDKKVQFISRGQGYGLFLTPAEAVLSLHKAESVKTKTGTSSGQALPVAPGKVVQSSPDQVTTLRMKLVGGNPNPQIKGLDELPGKVNYFRGKDPNQWRTNIPIYAKAKYEKIYPGIDLIYYGNQRQLEYDFIVAPGADPKAVQLSFEGAKKLIIDAQGDLVLQTAGGDVRLHKPLAYQTVDGQRRAVDVRFVQYKATSPREKQLRDQGKIKSRLIGFQLAAYDAAKTLVIDPVLAYSSYLGGNIDDEGHGITVDSAGNAYITGSTYSSDFPAVNALYPNHSEYLDAFVTKFDASGAHVMYSTYLGGHHQDQGEDIAVDNKGNAYVTGTTWSYDFPIVNAKFPNAKFSNNGLNYHAFLVKFDTNGTQMSYSTYLGGSGGDQGQGVAVDSSGNAYVTGSTNSPDFPTVNAIYPNLSSFYDAFVTKFDASGAQVLYSTYLGGNNSDYSYGIAVDSTGNAYVTGETASSDFPVLNAFYPNLSGTGDAFVTKLDSNGTQVLYSTYLGGNGYDRGMDIALDSSGSAYVTGKTESSNFPTVNAKYPNLMGQSNAFLTKFDTSGTQVLFSTYLGGNRYDGGDGIAVDSAGNAYVTGFTDSSDFPAVNTKYLFGGGEDAFVTKFDASGAQVLYSTYLGGNHYDVGLGIAVDSNGNAYVTGITSSSDFPTTADDPSIVSYDLDFNGGFEDAFVVKITDQIINNDIKSECLFNWAEANYPTLFAPSGSSTQISGVYTYRYYWATNAYLGVSSADNHVYYLGADGKLLDEGPLSDWLPKAGCQPPPPSECLFNWAEKNYPDLFAPSGSATAISGVYTYRYYWLTNAYLGVSSADNHVYYMGADGKLLDEGPLSYWLPKAGCQ